MEFEQIRYEKSEGVATITLNRPERMNAFTPKMLEEWLAALQDAHLDPETGRILRRGRGFCGDDVGAGQNRGCRSRLGEARTSPRQRPAHPRLVSRLIGRQRGRRRWHGHGEHG
jgi:enoyl-CoA hydratase/carnithine racemase